MYMYIIGVCIECNALNKGGNNIIVYRVLTYQDIYHWDSCLGKREKIYRILNSLPTVQ